MGNLSNVFYYAVIISSAIAIVWAIKTAIEISPDRQDRRRSESLTALARQQKTLVAVAEEQKAHHTH